jgi:23S rRNA (cytidine1920-2'-O)/16S rRNA (cytidine1409-2'-O)-methyltransferase
MQGNYVSRGGLKIDFASKTFKVNYLNKKVLDIGSSTGGFSDYALQHGAEKVIAIELGTKQMVEPLANDPRVELHEKTDILDVLPFNSNQDGLKLSFIPDIVAIDLSFVSLKKILPHVKSLINKNTRLIVLVKPQFEADSKDKVKGIVKNETIRRSIFKDFELWVRSYMVILDKVDSKVSGTYGNKERFYYLSRKINS